MKLAQMNVRAEEAPHEVLGCLLVPYAAAVGEMPVVRFEEFLPYAAGRGASTFATMTRRALSVHSFVVRGHRELAFKVPRGEWPELFRRLS